MLERPRAKLYFVHIRARKQKGEGRKEYEIGEGTYDTLGIRTKEGQRESTSITPNMRDE